ncbi:MAG: RNA polymerase sigma factor [Candidatus Aminicenantes bacterium]|nr:RNA polymerase sigma factor [Candidatus Aminicenantes bacterium]
MNHEEDWIDEVLQGKHKSFEALLLPYRNKMLSVTYQMTGNIEEAKEICQEVFLRVFRHLDKFKRGESFKNWLFAITTHTTYDFLRKKRRDLSLIERQKYESSFSLDNPESRFQGEELRKKILFCLRGLTPKERTVFILRDVEGESIKDTMKILGCSSTSVRTHLCRARRKIKDQFLRVSQKEGSSSHEMP